MVRAVSRIANPGAQQCIQDFAHDKEFAYVMRLWYELEQALDEFIWRLEHWNSMHTVTQREAEGYAVWLSFRFRPEQLTRLWMC